MTASAPTDSDVISLLLRQHEQIQALFALVETSHGRARTDAFNRLRRLLAVHETVEEMVLHPEARRTVDHGEAVVAARLQEEHDAKRMLEKLEVLDLESPEFAAGLAELKDAVLTHAAHEERTEFPQFTERHPRYQRELMGRAAQALAALAPTHPHAGVESATANVMVGPFVSMLDRSRDVLQQAIRKLSAS